MSRLGGIRIALWIAVSVVAAAGPASAQTPASRGTMDTAISVGQTVVVDMKNSEHHKGQVVAVSPVTLQLGRLKETIAASDISSIRIRDRDPVADGAKRGAVLGALAGAVIGYFVSAQGCHDGRHECAQANSGGGVMGAAGGLALGALTGAILDERHAQERVVWQAPQTTARPGARPMTTARRAGAHLTIRW